MHIRDDGRSNVDSSTSKTAREIQEEKKKAEEAEKRRIEEERQKQIDNQKNNEKKNITAVLNKSEDGFDEVKSKLSMVANILSEDILLNNVGYKVEKINNIKSKIDLMNK